MAPNKGFAPRGLFLTFSTNPLLTLLTLCLLFEILRFLTFTSATPIKDQTQRPDDSGPNDASIYQGPIDSGIESSETSKRDFGENVKAAFEDLGDTVKGIFNPKGDKRTPAEYVSEYAYNELDHQIPLEKLKESFEKTYKSMKHSDHPVSDEDWVHDQVKNVIPAPKKKYDEANKSDSASRHHERDADDKPRPKPGTPQYYTDPSFFPYPMPLTPNIPEKLKVSLGDAFEQWRANTTEVAISSCSAACSKADAITTKVDHTSEQKRKGMVEECIQSLIDYPSCLAKYQSTDVLKPYLTELVDKGTIKDEDGVIKKFYKRIPVSAGSPVTPELDLSQNFKDMLASAFKKYKGDVAIHSDMSCPVTKGNACENPSLLSGAGYDMTDKEREHVLETCIVFLSWHPNCLLQYETTSFIEPHLEALAASGKIDRYVSGGSEKRDGISHSPEPEPDDSKGGLELLDQHFKELLGHVFNDYKENIADHSGMSCPLSKENTCENSTLLSAAEADAMDSEERRWRLETCVIFLSWHPNCLQRYETKDFIKHYLEDLADRGKIDGYTPGSSALRRRLVHAVEAKPTATAKHSVSSVPVVPPDQPFGQLVSDSLGGLLLLRLLS